MKESKFIKIVSFGFVLATFMVLSGCGKVSQSQSQPDSPTQSIPFTPDTVSEQASSQEKEALKGIVNKYYETISSPPPSLSSSLPFFVIKPLAMMIPQSGAPTRAVRRLFPDRVQIEDQVYAVATTSNAVDGDLAAIRYQNVMYKGYVFQSPTLSVGSMSAMTTPTQSTSLLWISAPRETLIALLTRTFIRNRAGIFIGVEVRGFAKTRWLDQNQHWISLHFDSIVDREYLDEEGHSSGHVQMPFRLVVSGMTFLGALDYDIVDGYSPATYTSRLRTESGREIGVLRIDETSKMSIYIKNQNGEMVALLP